MIQPGIDCDMRRFIIKKLVSRALRLFCTIGVSPMLGTEGAHTGETPVVQEDCVDARESNSIRTPCSLLKILLIIIVPFALFGCDRRDIPASASSAMKDASEFELLSLDPSDAEDAILNNFHNWKILGRVSITDASVRKRIVDAIRNGAQSKDAVMAKCFEPRHGLHLISGIRVTDIIICFHCGQAEIYEGGKKTGLFATSPSPESVLDEILRAANVPLAPKSPQ